MSARDVEIIQQLQRKVAMLAALGEQLLEEIAEQAGKVDALTGRVATLEAASSAECTACATRRAGDAARQRRLRHRHATEAEPA